MGPKTGRQVLLVEDEWLIAEAIIEMLETNGLDVIGPARRIGEALALINRCPIDAAILDINLGTEKSFAVAAELVRRGVPFLFVTGYAERDIPVEFSGRPLLTKPIDAGQLRRALDGAVNGTTPSAP